MDLENSALTEKELKQISGGAGTANGKYTEGDLVTVKTSQYYYFGVLKRIEVYYDGDTRYVVESNFTAQHVVSFPNVREYHGTLRINPDNPTTGVMIKKIYDFPEPGQHHISYLSKWVD